MSEQGKRLARQKQSDSAYNKLLLSLAVAVVVELISLLLRRFTYTYYQSDFGASFAVGLQAFFGVFRIAGAVLAAAGCVWAVLSVRAKKRLLLPGICTGVVVWLWLVSLLCYSFSEAGVSAMCVLPPAGAVLAFIYFLYQREFFYNAILSGLGLVAVWVFRQIYMTHPRMVYCGFAVVWAVLAAAAVLTFRLKGKKGRLGSLTVFPEGSAYTPVCLTCAVVAAAMLAALIFGVSFGFYMLLAIIAWVFCLAVYYTVKLM